MTTETKPAIGTIYHTGDMNPVSGEFQCVGCEESGDQNIIPLSRDEAFPPCARCEPPAVSWRLIRYV